jgi:cytochrome c oxidase subunit 4
VHDAALRRDIAQRRPADTHFRLASVAVAQPGTWLRPETLTVTFHAVDATHDAALQHYLATHQVGQPPAHTAEPAAEPEEHATVTTYVKVALLLAVMTVVEVAAFYLPEGLRPPRWALLIVLLLLSACKFGIVASFFMHLRYDHRIYAGCFMGGLVVTASTVVALVALFRDPSHLSVRPAAAEARPVAHASPHTQPSHDVTPRHASVEPQSQGKSNAGTAVDGKQIFAQLGCGACHMVSGIPNARGNIGPALDGVAQRAATRIPGMSGDTYLRQSIEDPGAYVVQGYLKLMPALRSSMTDEELTALVAWLGRL